MRTKLQSNFSHLWRSSSGATTRGVLQRKCGCGENCGGSCSQKVEDSSTHSTSPLSRVATQTRVGHNFSKVPVLSPEAVNDQTQSGGLDPKFMGGTSPEAPDGKDISMGDEYQDTSKVPVIDQVDLVTSSTGAVGGYPAKMDTCDASLNNPGPFNDNFFSAQLRMCTRSNSTLPEGTPEICGPSAS